jgi:hypothetical protein
LSDRDPVPGDPYQVAQLAKKLRTTANLISDQAQALRGLCTDEFWDSEAGEKFRSTAVDTANKLDKTYRRYDAAASATEGYGPELDEAQRLSLRARTAAQNAQADKDSAASRLSVIKDPKDADPQVAKLKQLGTDGDTALAAAHRTLQSALDIRDDAARRAAAQISQVIEDDGLKDGFWDGVKHWIHQNADWIKKVADIAGWVATACGVLALLVGWIPIIGQALAAVLTAVALVATAISLLCHLALILSGDGNWLDVGIDVIGLLSFGIGRAATGGVRAGAAGLRSAAKTTAAAEAVSVRVVARGGRVGEKLTAALARGDFRAAYQESGIERGLLKGWTGNAWGDAAAIAEGGQQFTRGVMAAAPKGLWPGAKAVAEGFSPRVIYGETHDAFGPILTAQAWRDGATAVMARPGFSLLDLDVAREAKSALSLSDDLINSTISAPIKAGLQGQIGLFNVSTLGAVAVDFGDKRGLFDGLK